MRGTDNVLYRNTPEVSVIDNRGLTVRSLRYHRHPDSPTLTDERITRHHFNARNQLAHTIDPRLFARQQHDSSISPNLAYVTSLTGEILRTDSIDAGTTVILKDIAGRPTVGISANAVIQTFQYESDTLPGRLLSLTEHSPGDTARITGRFIWAGNSLAEKALNLAGLCISHYDTAGLMQTNGLALTGVPLSVTRHLLKDADNQDTVADWQGLNVSAWNDLLDDKAYTTQSTADSTGAVLTTTDAQGNQQRLAYDVAGLLSGSWLMMKGETEHVIVRSVRYSAAGQKLQEIHGNGVVTLWHYEPETQRLLGIKTERPVGHAKGARLLQNLRYTYDPVGNVLQVTNDAEATRFWRNQKVVPENTYTYDSLYQLVEATGREMANIGQQSSGLPSPLIPLPTHDNVYTHYTRTYRYDRGDNLEQIRHHAPTTGNNYTTDITVSARTNRAVLRFLTEDPNKVDDFFDAGGHQIQLLLGQTLLWTARGELRQVTPVTREGAVSDNERYRYASDAMRISKTCTRQSGNNTQTQHTQYLPGLELRTIQQGDGLKEDRHTVTVGEAGRAQVRVLHWNIGLPEGISNNQVRYSYDNLIGSSGLEVDGEGELISLEEYYPYGGTAVWTARSQVEANYKTIRYSGKERDATGLYYYGYRYYQPWAGRWLSADPAGTVDGLNLFRMVQNNPITGADEKGLFTFNIVKAWQDRRAQARANKSYNRMLGGSAWSRTIIDTKSIDIISRKNIETLREKTNPLTEKESDFFNKFNSLEFKLVHFTDANLEEMNKTVFRSRINLSKKGIPYNQDHTDPNDITNLATDDFSFFSIGIQGVRGKSISRFGTTKHEIPLKHVEQYKYIKYSHIVINDTLKFEQRQTSELSYRLNNITAADIETLFNERIAKHPSETLFSYQDFKEGIALRMIDSSRKLTPKGKEKVLNIKNDIVIDKHISLLFRPQFLVPKKLEYKNKKH
ncbi:RHS repeat domain-containing protein [Yersinia enterocolitica]